MIHAASRPPEGEALYFPYLDPKKIPEWIAQNLANEVGTFHARTMVLSDERIFPRLSTVEEVTKVRDLLAPFGTPKVVCFLRPQEEVLFSGWAYEVQKGNVLAINTPPGGAELPGWLDYGRTLDPWRKVFGADAVVVRPWKPGAAILEDVAALVGFDLKRLAVPGRLNRSLSASQIEWARHFAAALSGRLTASGVRPETFPQQQLVERRVKIRDHFARANQLLATTYWSGADLLTRPTAAEHSETHFTVEQSIQFAADYYATFGLTAENRRHAETLYRALKARIQERDYQVAVDIGSQLLDVPNAGQAFPLGPLRYRLAGCLIKCGCTIGAAAMLAGIGKLPDPDLRVLAQAAKLLFDLGQQRLGTMVNEVLENRGALIPALKERAS